MNNEARKQYTEQLVAFKNYLFTVQKSHEYPAFSRAPMEWRAFEQTPMKDLVPKSLYRYQVCDPKDSRIKTFEIDHAWFSFPEDFGDSLDMTVLTNIQEDSKKYEKDPKGVQIKLICDYLRAVSKNKGVTINLDSLSKLLVRIDKEDFKNLDTIYNFLIRLAPKLDISTRQTIYSLSQDIVMKVVPSLENAIKTWKNLNQTIRELFLVCCFSERCNIPSMWQNFTDGDKGFCVEYQIKPDTNFGKNCLLDLWPAYYGSKPVISLNDVILHGLQDPDQINGISQDDWQKIFLSQVTKDKSFESEEEWRIILSKNDGVHSQRFPYATSVTLGLNISKEHEDRLLSAAKKKGIPVFKRRLNPELSKIERIQIYPKPEDN